MKTTDTEIAVLHYLEHGARSTSSISKAVFTPPDAFEAATNETHRATIRGRIYHKARSFLMKMERRGLVTRVGKIWTGSSIPVVAKELPKVEVSQPTPTVIHPELGVVHKSFAAVMRKVQAGVPIMLVGPAGSGKTYLAAQVAKALKRPFTFNSMSEGVSESSLLGRTLPDEKGNWCYKPAPFVVSYRDGGVHLLDEIDAADPNLLVQVNAAIANGLLSIPFADHAEPIRRHKNSIILAAANTFGLGANRQYVGRNQLDAATLNRFTMGTVEIDYDTDLERKVASTRLGERATSELLTWAWKVRAGIANNGLRRIMSTRNIEDCSKLMAIGDTLADIRKTYLAGWTPDEIARVAA
jgi:dynein-related subfamily AAA family protein